MTPRSVTPPNQIGFSPLITADTRCKKSGDAVALKQTAILCTSNN